jgi:cell division septation protein DedD
LAQDDYYYEIQLTNKQLVFYFMAGATGLVLSFLAGIMVGRGVDAASGEVQAARVQEDRLVTEEPLPSASPSPNFSYAERLEGDKPVTNLEEPPAKPATLPPAVDKAKPPTTTLAVAPAATSTPRPAATKPTPMPSARVADATPARPPAAAPAAGTALTIQVGAFRDRASADSVMNRLKGKGYAAYVSSPESTDGLFNVRVGRFAARPEAERIMVRLRDEEKFNPFIVRQ